MNDDDGRQRVGTVWVALGLILVGPPLLLFSTMGFNFLDTAPLNPLRLATDADYRRETRERWQRSGSMWREIGSLLAIALMVFVTLCFYWAIYSMIRYRTLPGWMERTYCWFAACGG
jgi:hypothetical protein